MQPTAEQVTCATAEGRERVQRHGTGPNMGTGPVSVRMGAKAARRASIIIGCSIDARCSSPIMSRQPTQHTPSTAPTGQQTAAAAAPTNGSAHVPTNGSGGGATALRAQRKSTGSVRSVGFRCGSDPRGRFRARLYHRGTARTRSGACPTSRERTPARTWTLSRSALFARGRARPTECNRPFHVSGGGRSTSAAPTDRQTGHCGANAP